MLARERDGVKLGCSQFMGNRGNLHKLQNDFWQACGKPFGLQRGEPRTGARNLPVRQLYGALAAGAEVPELVPVPVVSLKDRLVAPEKLAQQAERYRRATAQADKAEKEAREATRKAHEARQEAQAMERHLADLDKRHAAKTQELQRLDADINNLRRIRDLERRNDYDR